MGFTGANPRGSLHHQGLGDGSRPHFHAWRVQARRLYPLLQGWHYRRANHCIRHAVCLVARNFGSMIGGKWHPTGIRGKSQAWYGPSARRGIFTDLPRPLAWAGMRPGLWPSIPAELERTDNIGSLRGGGRGVCTPDQGGWDGFPRSLRRLTLRSATGPAQRASPTGPSRARSLIRELGFRGVLPKAKTWENKRVGDGCNLAFAGVFKLKRRERRAPKTWATRPEDALGIPGQLFSSSLGERKRYHGRIIYGYPGFSQAAVDLCRSD